MITKEAKTALDKVIEKANNVIDQWQGPGLDREDRTQISGLALAQLRHALAVWKELPIVEA